MFTPTPKDVRQFFCGAYRKSLEGGLLSPLEAIAVDWIAQHPEYHADLADVQAALTTDYNVESGRTNPFLHLSMHMTISEQLGIDRPSGIKQAFALLTAKHGSMHEAQHEVMECLGEMMWGSQRSGLPLDDKKYIEDIRKRATRR